MRISDWSSDVCSSDLSVDFVFDNFERFLSAFFGGVLGFSLLLAAVVAVCFVVLAFPFTYFLSCRARRLQVAWLVALLSVLSLSEVIIGFAWSTLLSRTAGISNLLVAVGLLDQPVALVPNFAAVLTGMVYQALPYTILVLYPALARLDNSIVEAALTLGASPLRGFFTVVIPMLRNTIVATLIMVFVFALGAYLLPQILGRPQHWTLSVLITEIGRASCRERVCQYVSISVVAVPLKKKHNKDTNVRHQDKNKTY